MKAALEDILDKSAEGRAVLPRQTTCICSAEKESVLVFELKPQPDPSVFDPMPSFQQNASQWSFSHLNPEAALHSRHSTLSPLQTPSGSFDSLQNISPQAGLPTPTASANGSTYYNRPSHVKSLSAGYGRMNNFNVTVRRSTSATISPTPTIIVTEPMTDSQASKTAEGTRVVSLRRHRVARSS
ncbi:hypothetical protein K503DRAFT_869952 [Rhizopogon vinicolor AM-OR11-026]|uniref:Uncharacterized protein n=1 Tax=Rhizopogon vinicolor AM-OR11-026 TaxID=1314800 RepID=A0A1B7MJL6_9AGAM|nr:hypothetical protein K503DRAFT_869952 [Rhizopogon vinicolor AM-OR11-026]